VKLNSINYQKTQSTTEFDVLKPCKNSTFAIEYVRMSKKIVLITLQHILFWVMFGGLNLVINLQFLPFHLVVQRFTFIILLNAIVYYLCYNKLAPKFFLQKSYGKFYIVTIVLLIVSCLVRLYYEPSLIRPYLPYADRPILLIAMIIISQSLVVIISSMLSISNQTLKLDYKLSQAKLEKKEADLAILKAKINPHFLLNTLNNIYSVSYNENGKTSKAIMQLSQLLQYTIYDIDKTRISLQKEIETIHSLIGLHQLKYDTALQIHLRFPSDADIEHVEIPSMMLFSLIENAVKYSAIGVEKGAIISAKLVLKDRKLHFTITNSITNVAQNNLTKYKGFGLKSLAHLLEAEYPDSHELTINADDKNYTVNLSLNL
jgi:two-component system, LytTR family, sensor kinase